MKNIIIIFTYYKFLNKVYLLILTMERIPKFKIGDLEAELIQGGMGVGISKGGLAGAVGDEGGIGIIASVALGLVGLSENYDYKKDYVKANQDALRDEIRRARRISNGVIGVNIMHALSDYTSLIETSVEEEVDLIISGAGIPRDLPQYLNGKDIKLVPIVSSSRVANMICKAWYKFGHLPDAVVVEGPKAGGHLGFSREELDNPDFVSNGLERIFVEVIDAVKEYGDIPVIAAGGIFYGSDIKRVLDLGAAGVQMATRFVPTYECDADDKFKQAYVNCKEEDIRIINSPVGMPGRAIVNEFLERIEGGNGDKFSCYHHCLKTCNPRESPYCIANALANAQQGDLDNGFVFAGSNAYKCNEVVSVRDVFESLGREYSEASG